MSDNFLEKIVVWRNSNGSIRTTFFLKDAMLVDVNFPDSSIQRMSVEQYKKNFTNTPHPFVGAETEDEFISRQVSKLEEINPEHRTLQRFNKTRTDLNNILSGRPKSHKRKIKINNIGNLSIDNSIELPQNIVELKHQAAKADLQSKGFSNETIKAMIGELA